MKTVEYIDKQNSVNKSKHKTSKNIFHRKSNHNHLYKTCVVVYTCHDFNVETRKAGILKYCELCGHVDYLKDSVYAKAQSSNECLCTLVFGMDVQKFVNACDDMPLAYYSGELGFKTKFINLSDIKYEEIG